jgi:hypothetical protein
LNLLRATIRPKLFLEHLANFVGYCQFMLFYFGSQEVLLKQAFRKYRASARRHLISATHWTEQGRRFNRNPTTKTRMEQDPATDKGSGSAPVQVLSCSGSLRVPSVC